MQERRDHRDSEKGRRPWSRALLVLVLLLAALGWWLTGKEDAPESGRKSSLIVRHAGDPPAGERRGPGPSELRELMARYYLPNHDFSEPRPLPDAMSRLLAEVRRLNYLKRPALEQLKFIPPEHLAGEHDPAAFPVSCPLEEPTLWQVIQWYAAQLRCEVVIGDPDRIRFVPPRTGPEDEKRRRRVPLEMPPAWLVPPGDEGVAFFSGEILPLTPAEVLASWRISQEPAAPITRDRLQRDRWWLECGGSLARQVEAMMSLKHESRPPALNVTLQFGHDTGDADAPDRIVDAAGYAAWLDRQQRSGDGVLIPAVKSGTTSGQGLTMERITPYQEGVEQDWLGFWSGLRLQAGGEIVRISGTAEFRELVADPAASGSLAPASAEAEFEAFVPRGGSVIVRLTAPPGRTGAEVAVTVE